MKESGVEAPNNAPEHSGRGGLSGMEVRFDRLGGGAGNVGRGIAQGEEPRLVFLRLPLTQPASRSHGHDWSAGGATPTHAVGLH